MIIYLHGFRSSPLSNKAQRLQAHMASLGLAHRFWCEQLPPSPRDAIALAERQIVAAATPVTMVGSSLGGYYATHLAEKHRLKAVLVNPAVVAHLSLAEFVGPQTNLYTGETFEFRPEYIDALRAIEVPRISRPQDFLLLVETGARTTTASDGTWSFSGLVPRTYTLQFEYDGRSLTRVVTLRPNGNQTVDVALPGPVGTVFGSIYGRDSDSASPIARLMKSRDGSGGKRKTKTSPWARSRCGRTAAHGPRCGP